jgi:AcrR family transcriptional regulator
MAGTKDRILDSSAELFRRQGYTGTGVKQIAAEARAPFGSLYHFFPGGKEQLGEEVIRWSGGMYLQLFVTVAGEADDVVGAVEDFFSGAAETLEETDYADACPIATVALEVASTNEQLRKATADVFQSWIDAGTAFFANGGIPQERAHELTLHMLCALEGGFVFSRAMRTTEPLHVAGAAVAAAVRGALPDAG